MSSPVRDSWVLSGRDEGQQADFLLLFGCCSLWETGICAHLVSNWASCYGETPNSLANSSPLPIGTAYQTLKFFSQEVLVCCDSWQRIPVGKWWTGSGESKVNYEVGEISALQITVQWFHWNGSVWQHIQTHTAGQNTQTLLYGMSCLHGKRGSSPWINEPELGDNTFVWEAVTYGSVWMYLLEPEMSAMPCSNPASSGFLEWSPCPRECHPLSALLKHQHIHETQFLPQWAQFAGAL